MRPCSEGKWPADYVQLGDFSDELASFATSGFAGRNLQGQKVQVKNCIPSSKFDIAKATCTVYGFTSQLSKLIYIYSKWLIFHICVWLPDGINIPSFSPAASQVGQGAIWRWKSFATSAACPNGFETTSASSQNSCSFLVHFFGQSS